VHAIPEQSAATLSAATGIVLVATAPATLATAATATTALFATTAAASCIAAARAHAAATRSAVADTAVVARAVLARMAGVGRRAAYPRVRLTRVTARRERWSLRRIAARAGQQGEQRPTAAREPNVSHASKRFPDLSLESSPLLPGTLDGVVRQGKIRYIGRSNFRDLAADRREPHRAAHRRMNAVFAMRRFNAS
jgi:hypothetical protein